MVGTCRHFVGPPHKSGTHSISRALLTRAVCAAAPCPAGMVRCDEGKCILESLMCNDEDDCLDGTDEPSTCGEQAWGRGSCRSSPELFHPSTASLQGGAALCATGAVRRRVLTPTGACSAPAGPAGCCRATGRAVLVRRGWDVHTLALPEPAFVQEHPLQPCSCPRLLLGPQKAACRSCPCCHRWVWGLGAVSVVPCGQGLVVLPEGSRAAVPWAPSSCCRCRCRRVLLGVQPLQPAVPEHAGIFQLLLPPGLHAAPRHHLRGGR